MTTTRQTQRCLSLGAALALGVASLVGCGTDDSTIGPSSEESATDTVDTTATTASGGSVVSTSGDPNSEADENEELPTVDDLDDDESAEDTSVTDVPELDPDDLGGDSEAPEEPPASDPDEATDLVARLVGMTEADAMNLAQSAGFSVRVEERDGEQFILTQDYDEQRVNFTIEGDQVTAARIG